MCAISLIADQDTRIWPFPVMRLSLGGSLARSLPVIGTICACVAMVISAGGLRTLRRPLPVLLPLGLVAVLLLGAMVVAGALYARHAEGIQETFLAFGASMLVAPLVYWMLLCSQRPERILNIFVTTMCMGGGLVALLFLVTFVANEGGFSESLPVVIGSCFLCYATLRSMSLRWLVAGVLFGLCLMTLKKTGVVTAGLVVVLVAADACVRRFGATRRALLVFLGIAGSLAGMALMLGLSMIDRFRSGEMLFRQYSFEIAWQEFLTAPFLGQLFTGCSNIKNPYYHQGPVPVHNDVLDVMRQGGVVALVLFLTGTLAPVLAQLRFLRWHAICPPTLLWLTLTVVASYSVFLFNPVLHLPDIAWFFWAMVGMSYWQMLRYDSLINNQETSAWRRR